MESKKIVSHGFLMLQKIRKRFKADIDRDDCAIRQRIKSSNYHAIIQSYNHTIIPILVIVTNFDQKANW